MHSISFVNQDGVAIAKLPSLIEGLKSPDRAVFNIYLKLMDIRASSSSLVKEDLALSKEMGTLCTGMTEKSVSLSMDELSLYIHDPNLRLLRQLSQAAIYQYR